jgi:hypothetical protein
MSVEDSDMTSANDTATSSDEVTISIGVTLVSKLNASGYACRFGVNSGEDSVLSQVIRSWAQDKSASLLPSLKEYFMKSLHNTTSVDDTHTLFETMKEGLGNHLREKGFEGWQIVRDYTEEDKDNNLDVSVRVLESVSERYSV